MGYKVTSLHGKKCARAAEILMDSSTNKHGYGERNRRWWARVRLSLSVTFSASSESGRGKPHSKTLRDTPTLAKFRQVLECGCPLPLWDHPVTRSTLDTRHSTLAQC